MLRSGRVYVYAVEKRINQLQAYVERMRALTPNSKTGTGDEGPQKELDKVQTPEELDTQLGEIRRLLSKFKSSIDLNAKKAIRGELESKLLSLDREVARG